jgi:hypothetical protein
MQIGNGIKMWFAVLIAVCLPVMGYAGPVAVVDEPVYEFESVPDGVKVSHVFVIKNAGDADLLIENVLPP